MNGGWLAAAAVATPLALLGMLITVSIFAASGLSKNAAFQARTEERLASIESTLHDLNANFKGIQLQQLSSSPKNLQSIASAKEIVNQAIAGKLPISPEVLKSSGTPFVEAGANIPNAWDAALSFLTYRSVLNVKFAPPVVNPQPAPHNCQAAGKTYVLAPKTETPDEAARSQTVSVIGGTVPDKDAARMELLDHPNKERCGIQFIIYEMPRPDNELLIDGLYLKNVIIRNTRIAYHGGPIRLENVYFVNCTFDFPSIPQTRDLASSILASSAGITFNVPS